MAVSIQSVLSQNITMVFDSLDPQVIDVNKLKQVVAGPTTPMLMDTPGMIVAVFPQIPTIIQVGDQRIRVTVSKPMEEVGPVPLWETTVRCPDLVHGFKLTAYGFNYDVAVSLDDGVAYAVALNLCVSQVKALEEKLDAELRSVVPRLAFRRKRAQYDLTLDPVEEHLFRVHMNVHFEPSNNALPSADRLGAMFQQEYNYLVSRLPSLLEGGKW